MCGDFHFSVIEFIIHRAENKSGFFEPLSIDIIKRNMTVSQRFFHHAVADNIADKNGTAGTHKCNFSHNPTLSTQNKLK